MKPMHWACRAVLCGQLLGGCSNPAAVWPPRGSASATPSGSAAPLTQTGQPTPANSGPAVIPLPPQPTLAAPQLPQLPAIFTEQHANGARHLRTERAGAMAVAILQIDAGALHGPPGVAQLTAWSLVRGAASGSPTIQSQLNQMGAHIAVDVGASETRFEIRTTQDQIAAALLLLTRLASQSTLAGQQVASVRTEQRARIGFASAQGHTEVMHALLQRALLGGGDPSAANSGPGTPAELKTITIKQCDAFYQEHYHAKRSSLALVATNAASHAQTVKQALAQLRPSPVQQRTALSQLEGQVQRSFVVNQTGTPNAQLLLGVALPSQLRSWPDAALTREQLWESARVQLATTTESHDLQAELLPALAGSGTGLLVISVTVPAGETTRTALRLKNALGLLAQPPDVGTLSAMRHRVAARISRGQQHSAGVARWLLDTQRKRAPANQTQLRAMLKRAATPVTLSAAAIVALGREAEIAPLLRPLGEVLVVDAHDSFSATKALMPAFEILHDEPPETAPATSE